MSEYDDAYFEADEPEDDEADFGDCGLLDDGTCMLAGTEHCDWDCPHSG